ncbi:hypothetical protein F2Q69_00042235 [Brassica cretica]|uniref:Uncharacterized protein n=1 Tax=Brassica cretica TaxID=69181 RepID=A0A8S9N9T4_BRACR|nr:hypothetical protein F2Q69_00042235 [Brassica cretica]
MDFHSGLRTGLLIAFSYLMLLKAIINVGMTLRRAFMEPGGSWACSPKEPGDWMHFHPETRRLDGLSSRNPEVEWTFVLEPRGWMDFQGNLLVYLFDSKSPPSVSSNASSIYLWGDLKTEPDVLGSWAWSIGMHHIPPSVDKLLVIFSQEIACLFDGHGDSIAGSWDLTEPWFCFITQRGPGGRLGTWRFLQTMRSYLGPRGRVRTRRSFGNPEVPSDPEDEMLPHGGDWSELAGSLMENSCSYTRPQSRQDFSLHFLRVSESCGGVYGSGPKNSERENLGEAED